MWTWEERRLWWAMLDSMPEFGCGEKPVAESVTFDGESNGRRTTEKQASVYDAMLAEIYAERNKAKARRVRKHDNRSREERLADWENKKDARRWHHFDRDWKLYIRDWKARSDEMSHAERKVRKAEQVARADYEIELRNIAEDAEQMKIEAEYAEWERRYRHEKYMRELNNWLKWA